LVFFEFCAEAGISTANASINCASFKMFFFIAVLIKNSDLVFSKSLYKVEANLRG